jgi:ketosteroid isomerase-like protein
MLHSPFPRRAAAVVLLSLAGCAAPSGFTSNDLAAITAQAQRWADAVVAGDAAAAAAVYEAEGVLLPDGGEPVLGTEALTAWFAALPDVQKVSLHHVEVNGHGGLAYVLGTFRWKVLPDGATEPVERFGRSCQIWRRHSGQWTIARDLFHSLAAAAPETTLAPPDDATPADPAPDDAGADGAATDGAAPAEGSAEGPAAGTLP